MDGSRRPVDSLSFADQLSSFGIIDFAGIGKFRGDFLIAIQFCKVSLVAHRDKQLLFAFFGSLRGGEYSNPWSRFLELSIVTILVFGISQLVRCADHVTEDFVG